MITGIIVFTVFFLPLIIGVFWLMISSVHIPKKLDYFDKKGKNVPYLFVNPLEGKGDAGNNTNRVIAGSANGYTDCRCYFATRAEADAFLAKFVSKYGAKKPKK